jgi:DNA polymerase III delta subunit
MPGATAAAVRQRLAQRKPDPVYLIVGDDEAEMLRLASDVADLVETELRAFNVERMYAGEKSVTPAAIVESARILPMMSDRRVVVVLRAERLLKPKRRGKGDDETAGSDEAPADTDVLDAYIKSPVPETSLVLVASDVDRTRRLFKTLQKQATIVECWGL